MEENQAPFYKGQYVIAVDAHPKALIKNGLVYVINSCTYEPSGNPIAEGESFWYVGVIGEDNNHIRPSIFMSYALFTAINEIREEIGI